MDRLPIDRPIDGPGEDPDSRGAIDLEPLQLEERGRVTVTPGRDPNTERDLDPNCEPEREGGPSEDEGDTLVRADPSTRDEAVERLPQKLDQAELRSERTVRSPLAVLPDREVGP